MAVTYVSITTKSGKKTLAMDLDSDFLGEKNILKAFGAGQFYEPDLSLLMLSILEDGDVVVDVGANIGYFSVLAGLLVGDRGYVLSFEPDPRNLPRFSRNVEVNNLRNVTVIDRPASEKEGPVSFWINSDASVGSAMWDVGQWDGNEESRKNPVIIECDATRVDTELNRLGLKAPKLLKIDAEGAEELVLCGASTLLEDCQIPFVVAEWHPFALDKMGSSQKRLRDLMQGYGYSLWGLHFDGSLPKMIPNSTVASAKFIVNFLFSTPAAIGSYWGAALIDPNR